MHVLNMTGPRAARGSRRSVCFLLAAGAAMTLPGCGGSTPATNAATSHVSSTPAAASPTPSASGISTIRNCACPYDAGTYELGVLPGLQLTLPAGWSGVPNPPQEVGLVPPGNPDDKVFLFSDLNAVQSTGTNHGAQLNNVGTSSAALLNWLQHNRDFAIISKPTAAVLGKNIAAMTLALGVSRNSGPYAPGCKCVDIFTAPYFGDPYGIGGKEEVRIYLGKVLAGAYTRTMLVVLDAPNNAALSRLTAIAKPVLASIRIGTPA